MIGRTFFKMTTVATVFVAAFVLVGCGDKEPPDRRGQPAALVPVQSDGPAAGRIRAFLEEMQPGRYVLVLQTDVFPGTWVDVDLVIGAESARVAMGGWLAGGDVARLDVTLPGPPSMVVQHGGMRTVVSRGEDRLAVTAVIHTYIRRPVPETSATPPETLQPQ